MQLFVLDYDPEKAAVSLCDVHLRKMCLETAQILSGVLRLRSLFPADTMPGVYNIHHPVIRALRESDFRLGYVLTYNAALHGEYFYRFGKLHKYSALCPAYRILFFPDGIKKDLTPDWGFARSFKNFSPSSTELFTAFREYYCHKKTILGNFWSYTGRCEPDFLRHCRKERLQGSGFQGD